MIPSAPGTFSLEMAKKTTLLGLETLEEGRVPFLNHGGDLYGQYEHILDKSHGAELPNLHHHSAAENKGGKVCSMCDKTIEEATMSSRTRSAPCGAATSACPSSTP